MTATTLSANVFPGIASRTTGIATSSRYMAIGDSTRGNRTARPYLTKRQLQVLALLCEGLPNKLICRELGISAGTCKAHMSSILRELGVGSRLQAVVAARRLGLLDANGEDPGQPHLAGRDHVGGPISIRLA